MKTNKDKKDNIETEYVLKPKVEAFCRAYGNASVLVTSLGVIAKVMGILDASWWLVFCLITVPLAFLLTICVLWTIGRILCWPGEWFSRVVGLSQE